MLSSTACYIIKKRTTLKAECMRVIEVLNNNKYIFFAFYREIGYNNYHHFRISSAILIRHSTFLSTPCLESIGSKHSSLIGQQLLLTAIIDSCKLETFERRLNSMSILMSFCNCFLFLFIETETQYEIVYIFFLLGPACLYV